MPKYRDLFGPKNFFQCVACGKQSDDRSEIRLYDDGWLCYICRWALTPPAQRKEDFIMRSHEKGGHTKHKNPACNYCNGAVAHDVVDQMFKVQAKKVILDAGGSIRKDAPPIISLRQTSVRRTHL